MGRGVLPYTATDISLIAVPEIHIANSFAVVYRCLTLPIFIPPLFQYGVRPPGAVFAVPRRARLESYDLLFFAAFVRDTGSEKALHDSPLLRDRSVQRSSCVCQREQEEDPLIWPICAKQYALTFVDERNTIRRCGIASLAPWDVRPLHNPYKEPLSPMANQSSTRRMCWPYGVKHVAVDTERDCWVQLS